MEMPRGETASSCIFCGRDVYAVPGSFPVCTSCGGMEQQIDWDELSQTQGYPDLSDDD